MTNFRTFRTLVDSGQVQDLVQLLSDNDIESELVKAASSLNANFGGGELTKAIEIRISQDDFEKANSLLEKEADKAIGNIDKDHYLFEFSNEELYEILLKPDEWNELDNKLATKILKDRGEDVSPALLDALKAQRLKDLEKPEESKRSWIYAGYLFSMLGGFLGMLIGWSMWKGTKTLPDGRKVFSYNSADRKHGRKIFIIGVVVFAIGIIINSYRKM